MTDTTEQRRETIRETAAIRDIAARRIADHVVAGDTSSHDFDLDVRMYTKLTAELNAAQKSTAHVTETP